MSYTWRPGCPVPLRALTYLRMIYRGFDGRDRLGEMVVATGSAAAVVSVFRRLYTARFPIRSMALVDAFKGSDDASMAADNTSAFNCRRVTGGTQFSQHSYGQAIDLDPLENPYVSGGLVLPPAGARFVGRPAVGGVIHGEDVAVQAFAAIGWKWGGNWTSPRDYQHFSATGR